MRHPSPILIFAGVLLQALPSSAVIVGGTLGTGNNNNTEAGLVSFLAESSHAAFPYWNNLIRVSDASGVYLGINSTTGNGWVMTANHVTPPTSLTIDGTSYSVINGTQIGQSDLKLYEIQGATMPTLPTVPLATMGATTGEFLLMMGRGFTNNTSPDFTWSAPGTNDANGMRWGSNTVESSTYFNVGAPSSPNYQPYISVDFDGPSGTNATAYDAQAALGDSGGGLFIYRNGEWQLSGIAHFVDSGGTATNPSQFGDISAYSDVHSHLAAVQAVTGTLIPEPTASALTLCSLACLLGKRRRA